MLQVDDEEKLDTFEAVIESGNGNGSCNEGKVVVLRAQRLGNVLRN